MKNFLLLLLVLSCSTAPREATQINTGAPPSLYRDVTPTGKNTRIRVCLNAQRDADISIVGLLEKDGYRVIKLRDRASAKNLLNCDILHITSPLDRRKLSRRSALNDREVSNIYKWVKDGGSLLITPSSMKLINKFKVSLIRVRPLTNTDIFPISENQMNILSPLVLGRDERERLHNVYYIFINALKGPDYSDIFLKTGEKKDLAAGLALKLDRGRVVMFSDANFFTMTLDKKLKDVVEHDNKQLALNVFHWLSRLM